MVKVKEPVAVGVPVNPPVIVLRLIPGGRAPVCDHVIGVVPVAVKVKLYPVPTVPLGGGPDVMVGATGATVVCGNVHTNVTELAFI